MDELIFKAIEARKFSYSPYSGYRVGAALLCSDGVIYTGCNIENAAYSPTICAERTAFFKAVSEGERSFRRIAIVGGNGDTTDYAYPCGVCRQVMAELCEGDFEIIVAKSESEYRICYLKDMLPESFGRKNLAN
jgi:cytidine deaminase